MIIIQNEIETVIQTIIDKFKDPFIDKTLIDFITKGSKFIRSSLAILYLKSQGIEISEKVYKILAVTEIIHNASLLHDDVIDDAYTRRGNIVLAKKFNPKLSILAGDYLLSYAIEKLLVLKDFYIIELFKSCTTKMTKAEILQYFLRGNLPSKSEYLQICKGKTACLFSTLLESCAYLSNLDINKANKFGTIFGIYFQIKNDLNNDSANIDKKNGIFTANEVLGIEKTCNLLDNYKEEMRLIINDFPFNEYKKVLEDLIISV